MSAGQKCHHIAAAVPRCPTFAKSTPPGVLLIFTNGSSRFADTLQAQADDVFIGSPPLAFTFGLGGLLLFPLHIGASTVLLPQASPPLLLEGIQRHGATVVFTSPTSYRAMAARGQELRSSRLRHCVSAGEALPAATREMWASATGLGMIDGIGSTELLHIFIAADEARKRAARRLPWA